MRQLDLGPFFGEWDLSIFTREPWDWVGEAGLRLATYIAWPEDDKKRMDFLAAKSASTYNETVDWFKNHPIFPLIGKNPDPELSGRAEQLERAKYIDPAGGYEAIANADSISTLEKDLAKNFSHALEPGRQLYLCAIMHNQGLQREGGASLDKAIFLLQKNAALPASSERTLKDRWANYRSVSHLAAAIIYSTQNLYIGDDKDERISLTDCFCGALGSTLAVANYFANFGLTFIPHARSEALLDKEQLWLVPDNLTLPDLDIVLPKLSAEELKSFKDYRARPRGN